MKTVVPFAANLVDENDIMLADTVHHETFEVELQHIWTSISRLYGIHRSKTCESQGQMCNHI